MADFVNQILDFCEPALSCGAIKRDPPMGVPSVITPNMRP